MKIIRIVSALLIFALTAVIFCSCAGQEGGVETDPTRETDKDQGETKPTEIEIAKGEAEEMLSALPASDLDGRTITVSCVSAMMPAVLDESDPDYISVKESAELVEVKYNCKIVSVKSESGASQLSQIMSADEAGLYYCDFATIPQNCLGGYLNRSLLTDLGGYEGIGLDSGIYNSSSLEQFNIGGKQYAVSGFFSENIRGIYALYYEKNPNCDILYKKAADGKLTWGDVFDYYSSAGTYIDWNFGIACYDGRNNLSDVFFSSSGLNYLEKNESGTFVQSYVGESADKLSSYVGGLYSTTSFSESVTAMRNFYDGKAKLLVAPLDMVSEFTDKSAQWGILPIPKHSSEQEGYSSIASNAECIIVAPTQRTEDGGKSTGIIIRALCCSTYKTVREAAFTDYTRYNLRDNGSLNMLPLICDSECFDLAVSVGEIYNRLAYGTYQYIRKCFNSGSSVTAGFGGVSTGLRYDLDKLQSAK